MKSLNRFAFVSLFAVLGATSAFAQATGDSATYEGTYYQGDAEGKIAFTNTIKEYNADTDVAVISTNGVFNNEIVDQSQEVEETSQSLLGSGLREGIAENCEQIDGAKKVEATVGTETIAGCEITQSAPDGSFFTRVFGNVPFGLISAEGKSVPQGISMKYSITSYTNGASN